jgi:hypothetical protein
MIGEAFAFTLAQDSHGATESFCPAMSLFVDTSVWYAAADSTDPQQCARQGYPQRGRYHWSPPIMC